MVDFIWAILLGLIEGATEFIPVSSTGHLLLLKNIISFSAPPGRLFDDVIQAGAALAVCLLYGHRIISLLNQARTDSKSRKLFFSLGSALIPSVLFGLLLRDFFAEQMSQVTVVCTTLVAGGVIMLWVHDYEKTRFRSRYEELNQFPPKHSFKVGLAQCLAMIPGVSRSGASMVTAVLFGASRRVAVEFSFLLGVPTMLGAAAFDLLKHGHLLTTHDVLVLLSGGGASFVASLVLIPKLVNFIEKFGFGIFAWYRILVGVAALAAFTRMGGVS